MKKAFLDASFLTLRNLAVPNKLVVKLIVAQGSMIGFV